MINDIFKRYVHIAKQKLFITNLCGMIDPRLLCTGFIVKLMFISVKIFQYYMKYNYWLHGTVARAWTTK